MVAEIAGTLGMAGLDRQVRAYRTVDAAIAGSGTL
jgi:hypothetical protein